MKCKQYARTLSDEKRKKKRKLEVILHYFRSCKPLRKALENLTLNANNAIYAFILKTKKNENEMELPLTTLADSQQTCSFNWKGKWFLRDAFPRKFEHT